MKNRFVVLLVGLFVATIGIFATAAPASAALCTTTLQQGSSGSCVVALQQRLNQLGAGIAADGAFGPGTKAAVMAFQGRSRIAFDGIVGSGTRAKLDNPGTVNLNRAPVATINSYINTVFGSNAPTAIKIAACESGTKETAVGLLSSNGSVDIGVFQVNTVHQGSDKTTFVHDMLYYQTNVQKAHQLFVSRGNWDDWNSSISCWG